MDEITCAAVPLKVIAFWAGVALKPVPEIVTVVPGGPLVGAKPAIPVCPALVREIDRMLPIAS